MSRRPGRAAHALLAWAAGSEAEAVLGDFAEGFAARRDRDGLPAARAWARAQLLRSAPALIAARLRRARAGQHALAFGGAYLALHVWSFAAAQLLVSGFPAAASAGAALQGMFLGIELIGIALAGAVMALLLPNDLSRKRRRRAAALMAAAILGPGIYFAFAAPDALPAEIRLIWAIGVVPALFGGLALGGARKG